MKTQLQKWQPSISATSMDKRSRQRRIALLALGIVRALRDEKMSLDQAQDELFNPDIYRELKRQRYDRSLIELVAWGMELENVYRLVPKSKTESFTAIENLATSFLTRHHRSR